jgi:aspartyl/asparaginyl-tRNA synthetase
MKREIIKAPCNPNNWTNHRRAGGLKTRRDSGGGFSFIELKDGSCFATCIFCANRWPTTRTKS